MRRRTWAAIKGRAALKVEWDDSAAERRSSRRDHRRVPGEGRRRRIRGQDRWRRRCGLRRRGDDARSGVRLPLPRARADGAARRQFWSRPTTDRSMSIPARRSRRSTRRSVAGILGLDPAGVRIHTQFAGGSFGRRAQAGRQLHRRGGRGRSRRSAATRPVKHLWLREDDIRGGFYRPALRSPPARRDRRRWSRQRLGADHRRPVDHDRNAVRGDDDRTARPDLGRGRQRHALFDPQSARLPAHDGDRRAGALVALGRPHPYRLHDRDAFSTNCSRQAARIRSRDASRCSADKPAISAC